jgi:hypothetical protein
MPRRLATIESPVLLKGVWPAVSICPPSIYPPTVIGEVRRVPTHIGPEVISPVILSW